MGLLSRLFGARVDPEALADGEFVAFPTRYSSFGNSLHVRFVYTPDPRHQSDAATVHGAVVNEWDRPHPAWKQDFHRYKPFCQQLPMAHTKGVALWVRDFAFPIADIPPDYEDHANFPHWLTETGQLHGEFAEMPGRTPAERSKLRIRRVRKRGGRLARTALIQANFALFEPGTEDLPCEVLYAPDDRISDEQLQEWASAVSELKNTEPDNPTLAAVAALTTDERFVYYRRDRLPKQIVGRHDVFVAQLYARRAYLPDGYISDRILHCLAEPGERGMIEHVPEDYES